MLRISVAWALNRAKAFAKFWLMIGVWWLLFKAASTAVLWALIDYRLLGPAEAESWESSLANLLVLAAAGFAVSGLLRESAEDITNRANTLKSNAKTLDDNTQKLSDTANSIVHAGSELESKATAADRRLTATSGQLQLSSDRLSGQVVKIDEKLNNSASAFGGQIDAALQRMQATLDAQLKNSVDGTTDALLKKLQSVQKDIATQIEEAVAEAMTNGIKRGREGETAAEKAQDDARWARMSDLWASTKSELNDYVRAAREEISDGRSRRRYGNFSGHHYDDIAITLFGDDRLSSEATDAVIEMQAMYNAKKNRRQNVTEEDLREFELQREIWENND